MKSKFPKDVGSTSRSNRFKVGDLVMYAPYYQDGEGSWIMAGDLGVVLETRTCSEGDYQVVKVKWVDDGVDMVDMAAEVLLKINLDKIK
jgi:threonine dehydrogenase-like Zn-dependent dehydrogenase